MLTGLLTALVVGFAIMRAAVGYPDPGRRYRALGRGEVAFVSSAAEAMYPSGGTIPSSGLDADLPSYIDRLMMASRPQTRRLMHLLFILMEHATLFFPAPGRGGMRRFSALESEQRVAVLDGWAESALFVRRLVFTSLRAVLTLGYFAHPPVVRTLGLAPPAIDSPICEADLLYPRIGEHPESIQRTRSDLTPPSAGVPLASDGPLHDAFTEPSQ
jgi:hypothetical protein